MNKQEETDFDKMENVGQYFIDLAKRGRELIAAFETQIEPKPEPKKEPRGLCWVWDGFGENPKMYAMVIACGTNRCYKGKDGMPWGNAIPLADSELQQYRGRWE